jgi:hypothetical protein
LENRSLLYQSLISLLSLLIQVMRKMHSDPLKTSSFC